MNPQHAPAAFEPEAEPPSAPSPRSPQRAPKRRAPFGHDPFADGEQRAIRAKLDVGLSRADTMQRPGPGGIRITYIEGWRVIHDANQIFGFNGWSSAVVALDLRYVDDARGRFSACVSAAVRVTLRDGASREDRGGGLAENMRSKGDAILKAEKEAVTDATKRALKNFGLRLGLSLYDRQHVRDMNRPQPRDPAKPALHPNQHRFNQKPHPVSPLTPAAQAHHAFHKPANHTAVSSTPPPKTSIASALAANVAATNRQHQEDALLRKQVALQQQRARANQSAAAVSASMAASAAFQNRHALRNTTVGQMAARHLGSVAANFQQHPAQQQPAQLSNPFSAALSIPHTSAHLQPPPPNHPVPIHTAGLSVHQQFALDKPQFAMRGPPPVNPTIPNPAQRRNPPPPAVRPTTSCSSRTRSVSTNPNLPVNTNIPVPHPVDAAATLALAQNPAGPLSIKQAEIDELSAIALADF